MISSARSAMRVALGIISLEIISMGVTFGVLYARDLPPGQRAELIGDFINLELLIFSWVAVLTASVACVFVLYISYEIRSIKFNFFSFLIILFMGPTVEFIGNYGVKHYQFDGIGFTFMMYITSEMLVSFLSQFFMFTFCMILFLPLNKESEEREA